MNNPNEISLPSWGMCLFPSRVSAITLLLLLSRPLVATTFLVPSDDVLARHADAIVSGTVISSESELDSRGRVITVTRLETTRVFKGLIDETSEIEIIEKGGVTPERASWVSGTPHYESGEKVLVFLRKLMGGRWTTHSMVLGKFNYVKGPSGKQFLVRGYKGHSIFGFDQDGREHTERPRYENEFVGYLEGSLQRRASDTSYFAEPSMQRFLTRTVSAESQVSATAYSSSPAARWNNGATANFPINLNGASGLDYTGSALRGAASWNNDQTSAVNYSASGNSTASFAQQDGRNVIVFNVPADSFQMNVLGIGGWTSQGQHSFAGQSWLSIVEGDVKVSSAVLMFGQTVLDAVVTHELGHTLGFRHSDQGTPSSNDAIMKSVLSADRGAQLGSWDREALSHMYGSGGMAMSWDGDVNADGTISVADVFYLTNFLFASGPPPIGSGDVNNDQSVTVSDAFYLVNYLFAGGEAPQ